MALAKLETLSLLTLLVGSKVGLSDYRDSLDLLTFVTVDCLTI